MFYCRDLLVVFQANMLGKATESFQLQSDNSNPVDNNEQSLLQYVKVIA